MKMAASRAFSIFSDITTYILEKLNRSFKEIFCLHFQA
jgi:hypothetical protein